MGSPEPSSLAAQPAFVPFVCPRICLSMIVRNEAATIARCLSAALPLIDAAVICDTGSSDATASIAEALLGEHRIPSRVLHHAWQDFGRNRTAAIAEATRLVEQLGWPLDQTYWLFLDADLEIQFGPTFERQMLVADAIALHQRTGDLSYWNLRLARASLGWSAIGRTHECYTSRTPAPFERLTSAWIRDHHDGGSRAEKFARDIDWLTRQLSETPDDPRTIFYLAQSHRAVGDPLKALLLYQRRRALANPAAGAHDSEAWYSGLCIGQILADANYVDMAASALLEAAADEPARAEPLYELSRLYVRHERVDDAIALAQRARALPFPEDAMHFVHADVYEHRIDLQLAEAAIGTAHHEAGRAAADRVVLSRVAPASAIDDAQQLAVRYAAPLDGVSFYPLSPAFEPPWRPCNPSILRTDSGFLVICRAVNYEQRRLRYRSFDDDGIYRTRNMLMHLDRACGVLAQHEIVLSEPALREATVRGLEDCRLFAAPGGLMFTCATADRHPSGRVHQSLCTLGDAGRVIGHRPLVGCFDHAIQKNWLPFASDSAIHAIHSYDPLTIVRIAPETGAYEVVAQVESRLNAARWRGSAGPVAWPREPEGAASRYLVLVHEAVRRQGPDSLWERVYLHRFAEYDAGFQLTRASRPFVFAHKGVEFACGMTITHDGRELMMTCGIEDRAAYLARLPLSRVEALLHEGSSA